MNISCMESVCRTLFENIGRSRKKDNTKVYVSHLNDNTNFHFPKPETVFEMELPTLGKNCMRADCNVLDFLPIKCQYCGDFFCSKHFLPSDHDCKCYDSTFRPAGKRKNQNLIYLSEYINYFWIAKLEARVLSPKSNFKKMCLTSLSSTVTLTRLTTKP